MTTGQELTEQYKHLIRKAGEALYWLEDAVNGDYPFSRAYYLGVRDTFNQVLTTLGMSQTTVTMMAAQAMEEYRAELLAQAESIEASA